MTRSTTASDGVVLRLRVQPRAARSAIVGWREDGALALRVTAPPVDGAANAAVCTLLAEALGVSRTGIALVQGARGRDKRVKVTGLTLGEVRARLATPAGSGLSRPGAGLPRERT
jgi:uncharacterized protein (TIGR00251 family)